MEWKRATRWYCRRLLGPRILRHLSVGIDLQEYIRGEVGSITCLDWKKPREFHVQIMTRAGKRRKQLTILAHEMIHLKQMVRGELVLDERRRLAWRGGKSDRGEAWEEEAYGMEAELFREYVRSI